MESIKSKIITFYAILIAVVLCMCLCSNVFAEELPAEEITTYANNYEDLDIDYYAFYNKEIFIKSLYDSNLYPLSFTSNFAIDFTIDNIFLLSFNLGEYDPSLNNYNFCIYLYPSVDIGNYYTYNIEFYFSFNLNGFTDYYYLYDSALADYTFDVDYLNLFDDELIIDEIYFSSDTDGYMNFECDYIYYKGPYANHYFIEDIDFGFDFQGMNYGNFINLYNYILDYGEILGPDCSTNLVYEDSCPSEVVTAASTFVPSYYSFTNARLYYEDYGYNVGYGEGLTDGYIDGKDDGHQEGYQEGFFTGEEVGLEQGYNNGYQAGSNDGYQVGSNDGYNTGYGEGFIEGSDAVIDAYTNFYTLSFDNLQELTLGYASDEGFITDSYSSDGLNLFKSDFEKNRCTFYKMVEEISYLVDDNGAPYYETVDTFYSFYFKNAFPSSQLNLDFTGFYKVVLDDINGISYTFNVNHDFIQDVNTLDLSSENFMIKSITFFAIGDFSDAGLDNYLANHGLSFNNDALSSYQEGYNAGVISQASEIRGLKQTIKNLEDRLNNYVNNDFTLSNLFWSIGSIPFESFKQIWNVDFLGFNLGGFMTGFFVVLIAVFIIKKFLK